MIAVSFFLGVPVVAMNGWGEPQAITVHSLGCKRFRLDQACRAIRRATTDTRSPATTIAPPTRMRKNISS